MNKEVILLGTSGHAKVIQEAFLSRDFNVIAVFDDTVKSWEGFESIIEIQSSYPEKAFISIGNNKIRKDISLRVKAEYTTITHTKSVIAQNVQIGDGSCVMAGCIIQPAVVIGKHCIINTRSSVDHDCELEDFVHISPGATLCGGVRVGEGAQVGAGSVVIPGVQIGKWAIIGAGAVIVKDVPDGATVVGNPGKIIKQLPLKCGYY